MYAVIVFSLLCTEHLTHWSTPPLSPSLFSLLKLHLCTCSLPDFPWCLPPSRSSPWARAMLYSSSLKLWKSWFDNVMFFTCVNIKGDYVLAQHIYKSILLKKRLIFWYLQAIFSHVMSSQCSFNLITQFCLIYSCDTFWDLLFLNNPHTISHIKWMFLSRTPVKNPEKHLNAHWPILPSECVSCYN